MFVDYRSDPTYWKCCTFFCAANQFSESLYSGFRGTAAHFFFSAHEFPKFLSMIRVYYKSLFKNVRSLNAQYEVTKSDRILKIPKEGFFASAIRTSDLDIGVFTDAYSTPTAY